MWPIWELNIFGNRGFFKVMAILSRYGFVDKYGDYIIFWLSYMCHFSSLSLVRNDRIGHFDMRCFFGTIGICINLWLAIPSVSSAASKGSHLILNCYFH